MMRFVSDRIENVLKKKEKMLITSIFSYFSHFQNALDFNLFDKESRGFAFVW